MSMKTQKASFSANHRRVSSPSLFRLSRSQHHQPVACEGGVGGLLLALAASLVSAASTTLPVSAQTQMACLPPLPLILKDYVYGYAPVALAATRALATAVPDATTFPGRAPINQFARVNHLATPGARLVPRPNADTLYTLAWLDLSFEPMILHVPDTAGRYYLMPLYDAYSNEITSIGSRTTGNGPGDYAVLGPQWHGALPAGLSGIVPAPTNTVWLIGRTLVRGQQDLASAVKVTSQYQLVPLTAYPNFLMTGTYVPPVNVPVTPPNPDFEGSPITSSVGFSKPEFFDVLLQTSLQNPPPPQQEPQAALLVGEGELLKSQMAPDIVNQADNAFICEENTAGMPQNGWPIDLELGTYGSDYLKRAATAQFGLGANFAADAVYSTTFVDVNGNALSGTNNYVIHFAPNQIPPVSGFWSLTLYDANGDLVANSINRYNVGSETGLVSNADGSIDIQLQNTAPATLQTNWLPTPATPFNLTLRFYWPGESILDGTYVIPGVEPTAAAQLAVK
jgi:hypothetical protein